MENKIKITFHDSIVFQFREHDVPMALWWSGIEAFILKS
jgi:hypothetical protein